MAANTQPLSPTTTSQAVPPPSATQALSAPPATQVISPPPTSPPAPGQTMTIIPSPPGTSGILVPGQTITVLPSPPATSPDLGHIVSEQSAFAFRCPDIWWSKGIVYDKTGKTVVFRSKGTFGRRSLKDASGIRVLRMRRHMFKFKWTVRDARRRRLCELEDAQEWPTVIEGTLHTNTGSQEVVLKANDWSGEVSRFTVEGKLIAEVRLLGQIGAENRGVFWDRSRWEVRVEPGVDVAFAIALARCRADVMHHLRR